ncbi:MAG: flagellar L-ring protein FlgH [Thermotogota bacterium]|nr:flagellar L-ring protein FlgH [Thermotogota bacterium]MDK2864540.1 flagellar L-ring protein FlgH [Thermotogota bacterium]HCZ06192.1 flagellar basal body L-ring protein [Thermotogota bacterium]
MKRVVFFVAFLLLSGLLVSTSLWNSASDERFKGLIQNARTLRVGDVILINIYENPSFSLSESMPNRSGGVLSGINSFFSTISNFDLSSFIPINNNPDTPKKVDAKSQPKVVAQIAAIIEEIDPLGNYVIRGKKEIKVGNDLKYMIVEGVVRPEDVMDGYVDSSKIANARIWYDGEIVFQQDPQEESWLGWILSGLANLIF